MNAARAVLLMSLAVACSHDPAPEGDVPAPQTVPVASTASDVPLGPPPPPDIASLTDDQRAELRRLVRDLEYDARISGFCGTVFVELAAEIERHGEAGWAYAAQVTQRPRLVAEARALAVAARARRGR